MMYPNMKPHLSMRSKLNIIHIFFKLYKFAGNLSIKIFHSGLSGTDVSDMIRENSRFIGIGKVSETIEVPV